MLDFTELLMAFEEEFGIEIPEEDEEKVMTINDAVAYIMTAEVVDYEDEEDDELPDKSDESNRQIDQMMYNEWVKIFGKEMADEMAADLLS